MYSISCPQAEIIGVGSSVGAGQWEVGTPSCSEDGAGMGCDCDQSFYPVCVANQTYFSPCHVGCTDWDEELDAVNKTMCSCAVDGVFGEDEGLVQSGYCADQQCANLGAILLVMFFVILVTFTNNAPCNIVLMRCVPTEYSGLSLSLNDTIYKLVGDIPGAITLGYFLDSSCKVKNYVLDAVSCSTLESCAIFDNARMGLLVTIVTGLIPKMISFAFAVLAYKTIMWNPELQKPYEEHTTKTGNFRRTSVSQSGIGSIREEDEVEEEEEE